MGLLRTADMVRRQIDRVLGPFGVTQQQYNVLRILRGAGPEGLPTLTVGQRMIEQTPGVTRLVDRLLKKGLVSRERATCDRRQVVCRITESGLALLSELEEPVNELDDRSLSMLSAEDLEQLIQLLDRIRLGLRAAQGS